MIPQIKGWNLVGPVGEDGSPRKYFRVEKNGDRAIFMDCSGPEIPGHKFEDFIAISKWLRGAGLNAPEIYEIDDKSKFLLVEDFGDLSFKKAIAGGADERILYRLAAEALERLRESLPTFTSPQWGEGYGDLSSDSEISRSWVGGLTLPNYYQSHVHEGRRRVIDWYAPIMHQKKNSYGWVEEYSKVWDGIERGLPPCPQGFLHIDFHAENLMWLPERAGIKRCGILDFQGAMIGPSPYDLANLLEDPRMAISPDLRLEILSQHDEVFKAWYRVLATQFHCRVIGQFIRLAIKNGKTGYLSFIPRVEGYIREGLKDPILQPLKSFFSDIKLDFHSANDLNARVHEDLIRSDAF